MHSKINIAIDGHSSCGKGTLARELAHELGYTFIDSGSMYRAVALYFLENEIISQNKNQVAEALSQIKLEFVKNELSGRFEIFLNNKSVEKRIREMDVAAVVSDVAALSVVRKTLVQMQQKLGAQKGVVMDGRDIGTVVFPQAELKIFMTADAEIRAERRYKELVATGSEISLNDVLLNLKSRDEIDSNRADSPLTLTADYRLLNNSHISQKEQLQIAMQWVKEIQNPDQIA
jgi:cytidylate kinase